MIRIVILFLLFLNSLNCLSQRYPCVMDLVKKNDTVFKNGEQTPFSGKYEEYYPGNAKVRGQYLNGLKQGEFIYYSSDYYYDSIVNYQNGRKYGDMLVYAYKNYPISKENYINDTLDGNACYWEQGQLDSTVVYSMGKSISSKKYPVEYSVYDIFFSISSENNGKIKRKYIEKNDSIQFLIGAITTSSDGKDSTILFANENYKIVSLKVLCFFCDHLSESSNSPFVSGYFKRLMLYNQFVIEGVIEAYGIQYKIPDRHFYVVEK